VVAFVASGIGRALALFPDVDFWMDFERVHKFSPRKYRGMRGARLGYLFGLQGKDLERAFGPWCVNSSKLFGRSDDLALLLRLKHHLPIDHWSSGLRL
jgi:hypothetical protein